MTDTPASASAMQRRVRQEEQVAELCAGVVRAFSGERDLHFRGKRLHRGRVALPWFAPHLHPSADTDDFASFRGVADGLALRLTVSDAALHESLRPEEPVERMLFEMLEQFRSEIVRAMQLTGATSIEQLGPHNVRRRPGSGWEPVREPSNQVG